jgi:tRNA G18 (ribose-2'-O)-methylase SpoU
VPSKHYDDSIEAISDLKQAGYTIVAMETTARSQVYSEYSYPEKVALIVGNEITGVDPRLMEMADVIVEIPTFGTKNSLNVAAALPIVLFEVLRQWRK